MVSTVVKENGIEGVKPSSNFPPGDYMLIGWDVDTTGRRLVDEICQIAAYTPNKTFSQYVMPFREPNFAAIRRHNIRVVTIGRFRVLKDITGNVLKTKSEISALMDFIQWLEEVWGKTGDGVILVSHEVRKIAAPLLLEALKKYNLLEKFSSIVKGFCNSFSVAEDKCAKSVRSFTLRTLSRVLLDKEEDLDSAADRARLAYQIVQHLCGSDERQGSGDAADAMSPAVVQAITPFTNTMAEEEEELAELKVVLQHQNSLRPVFGPMMLRRRQRAMNLRRLLAEAGINYENLSAAYKESGDEGVKELLKKLPRVKPKEMTELEQILHEHFDPEAKKNGENKPRKNKIPNKSGGGDASGSTTPETAPNSPIKVPSSSSDATNADSPSSNGDDSSLPLKKSSPGGSESTSPSNTNTSPSSVPA